MKYFSQKGLIVLFVIAELFPCFLDPGLKRHQKGLIFEEHFYQILAIDDTSPLLALVVESDG